MKDNIRNDPYLHVAFTVHWSGQTLLAPVRETPRFGTSACGYDKVRIVDTKIHVTCRRCRDGC